MPSKDISSIVRGWDPQPRGGVTARVIQGEDGVEFLQLRLDLGVLQMQLDGRPDGTQPSGCESLLDHYQEKAANPTAPVDLDDDDWSAIDAELMQYYHRRIGMLAAASQAQARNDDARATQYYRRAARDAEHNLAIMDFIRSHADDESYIEAHEQYRPLLVCHRTLAHSQADALSGHPHAAIDAVRVGLKALLELSQAKNESSTVDDDEEDDDGEESSGDNLTSSIRALQRLDRELRRQYGVDRTLREQLDDALDREDYEVAAGLRDQIRQEEQIAASPPNPDAEDDS